jgi:hypothetical protein
VIDVNELCAIEIGFWLTENAPVPLPPPPPGAEPLLYCTIIVALELWSLAVTVSVPVQFAAPEGVVLAQPTPFA